MEHRKKITYHKKNSKGHFTSMEGISPMKNRLPTSEYKDNIYKLTEDINNDRDNRLNIDTFPSNYNDNVTSSGDPYLLCNNNMMNILRDGVDYFNKAKGLKKVDAVKQQMTEIEMLNIELDKLKMYHNEQKREYKKVKNKKSINENGGNNEIINENDPYIINLQKSVLELEVENGLLLKEINSLNYKEEGNYDTKEMKRFIKDEINRMNNLLYSHFRMNTNNNCVPNNYKNMMQ